MPGLEILNCLFTVRPLIFYSCILHSSKIRIEIFFCLVDFLSPRFHPHNKHKDFTYLKRKKPITQFSKKKFLVQNLYERERGREIERVRERQRERITDRKKISIRILDECKMQE